MTTSGLAVHVINQRILPIIGGLAVAFFAATAQAQGAEPKSSPQARVIVVGEGSVTVTPDYARISSGVTTSAKTVKEAGDTNAKIMTNIIQTLVDAGIAKKDIQTSQFSIEPVANQVNVTIHQIAQVGDILDRLVKAGATDAGSITFLVSDREKTLDQAREAAFTNARHKAELYAHAAGVNLGHIAWITESSDVAPILDGEVRAMKPAERMPIEVGENTITARVTVGFDIAE